MRRFKPAERKARAQQVISITATRYVTEAANDSRIAKRNPTQAVSPKKVEYVVGKGQYLGFQRKVTAFVWLDDGNYPVAANEP